MLSIQESAGDQEDVGDSGGLQLVLISPIQLNAIATIHQPDSQSTKFSPLTLITAMFSDTDQIPISTLDRSTTQPPTYGIARCPEVGAVRCFPDILFL